MSSDPLRALAILVEKDIARQETSDGVCDRLTGTAVQVDSRIVVASEQQRIVGSPQCRSENVGHTWLSAAIACVAFRHAHTDAHLFACGYCDGRRQKDGRPRAYDGRQH